MNSLFKTVTCSRDTDQKIVSIEPYQSGQQKIFIKDLALEMFIGVLDKEKIQKQRVVVSIEINVQPNINWHADQIDNVVSYADIANMIKDLPEKYGPINLVETFAEMITEECFKNPLVTGIKVTVEKPDIIAEAGSVGVQISRQK